MRKFTNENQRLDQRKVNPINFMNLLFRIIKF